MSLLTRQKDTAQKTTSHTDWFDAPLEAPRADLDRMERNSRRQKWRIRFIWAAVICLPLCLFAMIASVNSVRSLSSQVSALQSSGVQDASVSTVNFDPGKFAATESMLAWLQSVPNPLPGGQILSWDGSKSVGSSQAQASADATSTASPAPVGKVTRLLESFTLVDGAGRGYNATVLVAIDPRGGAVTLDGPSLTPIAAAANDGWQGSDVWPGVTVANDSAYPSVATAIQSWAQAYTSGDPDQLRVAVGDTDGNHTYLALSGITSVTAKVTALAQRSDGNVMARVQLSATWAGRSSTQAPEPIVLDVLVQRASTAAPLVVAWGGPGTGPSLSAYSNAITVPSQALGTATASATPTGGDTGGTAPAPAHTTTGKKKG